MKLNSNEKGYIYPQNEKIKQVLIDLDNVF